MKVENFVILTEREGRVAYGRWVEGKTLESLAEELGVSRERIRQIESKAQRRLLVKREVTRVFRNDVILLGG